MAVDLRRELRRELTSEIAENEPRAAGSDPDRRAVVRLGILKEALDLVVRDRSVFPEIERIAVMLWQYGNGSIRQYANGVHASAMDLAPRTRRVMLVEAATTYVIVHGASRTIAPR